MAKSISAAFEKCNPESSQVKCKTDAEIENWLRGKFILLFINEKNFVQDEFDADRIDTSSRMIWLPMTMQRTGYVF